MYVNAVVVRVEKSHYLRKIIHGVFAIIELCNMRLVKLQRQY
jgi:hypothetical protein